MRITYIDHMRVRGSAKPGWYMWSYPEKQNEFVDWMQANMTEEFQAIPRFNSGVPMVETFITGDADYALFKLVWMCK